MMDDERYSFYQDRDEPDDFEDIFEPQPYWTPRRIIVTIIILVTLIAFIAYSLQGLFFQPPPPPRPTRLPPMIFNTSGTNISRFAETKAGDGLLPILIPLLALQFQLAHQN